MWCCSVKENERKTPTKYCLYDEWRDDANTDTFDGVGRRPALHRKAIFVESAHCFLGVPTTANCAALF